MHFAKLISTLTIVLSAIASPAVAQQSPDLPGRGSLKAKKTAIFTVSSQASKAGIYRAVVSCEAGRAKKRRFTDRTGTAPLTFNVKLSSNDRAFRTLCYISKSGYAPTHKIIEFRKSDPPKLVHVELMRAPPRK